MEIRITKSDIVNKLTFPHLTEGMQVSANGNMLTFTTKVCTIRTSTLNAWMRDWGANDVTVSHFDNEPSTPLAFTFVWNINVTVTYNEND